MLGWDDSRGEGLEGMVLMVDFNPLAVYFRPKADSEFLTHHI